VDGTGKLQNFFPELLNTYLVPLLAQQQKAEYGLVVFRDYSPCAQFLVRCSQFTTDQKEFRSWLASLQFTEAGYAFNSSKIVEGLCAAFKMSKQRETKEKHVILVTNSAPTEHIKCRSCEYMDNCFDHASRLGAEQIMVSVISPSRSVDNLQRLFELAKTKQDDVNQIMISKTPSNISHLVLLRGLMVTKPNPLPPVTLPISIPILEQPKPIPPVVQLPSGTSVKPLWEGNLSWQPSAQGSIVPVCELSAYPSSLRPETDVSVFGALEWPTTLTVTGVCNSKDTAITQHFKNAHCVEFTLMKGSKAETKYKNFLYQLLQKSWAAVVYLPDKTLLIVPHSNEKLIGLIIPKLSLAPRSTNTTTAPLLGSKPNMVETKTRTIGPAIGSFPNTMKPFVPGATVPLVNMPITVPPGSNLANTRNSFANPGSTGGTTLTGTDFKWT